MSSSSIITTPTLPIPSPPTTPSKRKATTMLQPTIKATQSSLIPLPPMPDDFALPPLPDISDEKLRNLVFTHASYRGRAKQNRSLDLSIELTDNEKLEHVGDSILGVVVTLLLHRLYPNLVVGSATALKASLVENSLLAQISCRYRLPERLIAARDQLYNLRNNQAAQADVFEAYIAGLYLSYQGEQSTRVLTPPRTPHKDGAGSYTEIPVKLEPGTEVASQASAGGSAIARIENWLTQVYTPIAGWVLQEMMAYEQRTMPDEDEARMEQQAAGALARLNQHFTAKEGGLPTYDAAREGSDLWKVMCTAVMKDGHPVYAEAVRSTKKAASNIAAYKLCVELGL